MSEIEIGDYIRTRGTIGKLIRIESDIIDKSLKWYVLDIGRGKERYVNKPYIEKWSKNIIDLIKVRDLVEISCHGDYLTFEVNEVRISNFNSIILANDFKLELTESDIISILTREQYNQNCYKLED